MLSFIRTDEVAQPFLMFRRGELGDPVVLPAGSGCPALVSDASAYKQISPTNIEAISANETTTKPNPKKVHT